LSTNSKKVKKKPIILPDLSQKSFPTIPSAKLSPYKCNYDLVVIGSGPAGKRTTSSFDIDDLT